jgi:hypothetical protein
MSELIPDTVPLRPDHPIEPRLNRRSKRRRPYTGKKARPYAPTQLDHRTVAFKMYDALIGDVIQDLGGESVITTVQRELVEAFAGIAIRVKDLNTRGLAGQDVDLGQLSVAASTMVRLASRIGVQRIPREVEVTPSVSQYLRTLEAAAE